MILVAGGTGRLGTLVVRRLAARGLAVRVLTRDPARAAHLQDATTDVLVGDVRVPATLPAAMRGVTAVVSAVHGFGGPGRVSPASVDEKGNANLIDAAAAAGADVILLSVVGASATHPMELFRAKFAAEQHLRASSTRWTIVRCTAFRELWADIMTKPIVFGHGDNPINFVSVETAATAVEHAVVDPSLRGQVVDVGGPTNMTFNQLCAEFQAARGDTAKVRHIPRGLLRAMSPISRRAAAAVAMDTADMTFTAPSAHQQPVPATR
ncbi:MAG: SDR family oxidoreductase [Candidatus Dormibacteraeota bacterium]|nr:SDR family oxidoreductase [Candidatus Dormibacteraeota bacterium]